MHKDVVALIEANGRRFLECTEDWEAEIIEWQTILAIFSYGEKKGFSPSDYDLKAILAAEDDESPGVPEVGCESALIDLMERISIPEQSDGIDEPDLRELLALMESAFGREPQ